MSAKSRTAALPRRAHGSGITFPIIRLTPRRVASAMERTYRIRGSRELLTIKDQFQLTSAELGRLFGDVSRQAIDQWFDKGVPTNRVADVDRVANVAMRLAKVFKKQRLPAIVREPLPGLDNRSVLDVLRSNGVGPVNDFLDRLGALYAP